MTTLLVASAGGHLQELLRLLPVLEVSEDRVWVTYDGAQSRSLLRGEIVVAAHHPTTKSLVNAARNYRLAREVFDRYQVDQVISTGAAVAVPFMLRASQLGAPCHYVESAARVDGPSLSGRFVERLAAVHHYRQLGDWGGDRWLTGPCVFDGVEVGHRPDAPDAVDRIVVSLGTHNFPFDALVDRLHELIPSTTDVLWQLGSTKPRVDLPGSVVSRLAADRLGEAIAGADVVVGHAGVGLTLTVLAAGKVPVLVPRRHARREHTDDHQAQLARVLSEMGLAVTAEVEDLSFEHLERAAALAAMVREPTAFALAE